MPRLCIALIAFCLLLSTGPVRGEKPAAGLLKDIRAVSKEGVGAPAARAAWDRLVGLGPRALPDILEAMDTQDTVVANWLGTAFDRIIETDLSSDGKGIDADALLAFARDEKRQGRARRLALEVVDRLRPGTSVRLIPGWLEDPEFRFEAVAVALKAAREEAKGSDKAKTIAAYQKALASARDVQQVREVATGLEKLGVAVSVADHLGFLYDWYVIGPFDAKGMTGFKTVYPPEGKIDLKAEYPGKAGPVRWKRFTVKPPAPTASGHVALINLLDPAAIGTTDDAVGYAYTAFSVPAARTVEFRGAADDNFAVWVNGRRVFGFEEYRNGVRLDRHRFKADLQAGINTVLVKVIEAPRDPANPQGNWEFLLRVVDATGKGIEKQSTLKADAKK